MASLLDWDLESQVFPTVRWLVHHRRAKVVDIVHSGLKTVFTLPAKFDFPCVSSFYHEYSSRPNLQLRLTQLTAEFNEQFSSSGVPSLPQLLSAISTSSSNTHFFAAVAQTKEAIPLYHDVVLWMLKRDMLITLHLRIRIVATVRLKELVKFAKGRNRDKNGSGRNGQSKLRNQVEADSDHSPPGFAWLSLSPKSARRYSRQPSVGGSRNSRLSELILQDDSGDSDSKRRDDDETTESQEEVDNQSGEENEASMINDPGRATTLQRRWLSAMSDGKEPHIARRFEQ
jgi:hypothetical protein